MKQPVHKEEEEEEEEGHPAPPSLVISQKRKEGREGDANALNK